MKRITIAIDGYSGTGKSSTAKEVAKKLNYQYIDSGAMYRACTLYFLNHSIDLKDNQNIDAALEAISIELDANKIFLNGEDVSSEIRTMQVNDHVSSISAILKVREAMVAQQQLIGESKGIVMDGRDIGTVVFPEAELKIFMTADPVIRAKRRQLELSAKGIEEDLDKILNNLLLRDKIDSSRAESPLVKAYGAVEIDTSSTSLEEQIDIIFNSAKSIIYDN
ncbi:MAG: cytidylate kinase [Marinoscillum sp.]|jgi:cytidylate kinase